MVYYANKQILFSGHNAPNSLHTVFIETKNNFPGSYMRLTEHDDTNNSDITPWRIIYNKKGWHFWLDDNALQP